MYPYFYVFGLEIPVYGLISLLGVLVSAVVAFFLAKRRKVSFYDLFITAIVGGFGLLLGAHLLYALTRIGDIVSAFSLYTSFETTGEFIKYVADLSSGMVFYGGLLGGLFAGFLWVRYKGHNKKHYADIFAVVIPLFHAFGRVGCFFAGCCYGVVWEKGIAGRVMNSGEREYVSRFPVQLAEAFLLLVLFAVLFILFVKGILQGRLLTFYLTVYPVLRFVLEFFRGDAVRGYFLFLSTSQWISLLILISVGIYTVFTCKKAKHNN